MIKVTGLQNWCDQTIQKIDRVIVFACLGFVSDCQYFAKISDIVILLRSVY